MPKREDQRVLLWEHRLAAAHDECDPERTEFPAHEDVAFARTDREGESGCGRGVVGWFGGGYELVEQQMGSGCLRGRHEYPSRHLPRSVTLITIGREERRRTRMMRPRPSFAQNTSTLLPHLSKLCAVRTTAACITVGCFCQLHTPVPCSAMMLVTGWTGRKSVG
jgi:hypothetical protein